MSTTAIRRTVYTLDFEPLWRLALAGRDADDPRTTAHFAAVTGTNPRSVTRWKNTGQIPWESADIAATRLGYLPILVWGDEWLNVKGDLDDIVAGKYDAAIERDFERAFARASDTLTDEIAEEAIA